MSSDNSLIDSGENFDILAKELKQEEQPKLTPEELQKKKIEEAEAYRKLQMKKGICYLSSIPPFMTVSGLRRYFKKYKVDRIFLRPETELSKAQRKSQGGNKKVKFIDGWMEFQDRRVATLIATSFNGKKVGGKKGSFNYDDTWNIKYLPKITWEDLLQELQKDKRSRQQRFKQKLRQAKNQHDFLIGKLEKSKIVNQVVKRQVIIPPKISIIASIEESHLFFLKLPSYEHTINTFRQRNT